MTFEFIYLGIHAITTVGAIIGVYIRLERRLTRVETILEICFKDGPPLKKI